MSRETCDWVTVIIVMLVHHQLSAVSDLSVKFTYKLRRDQSGRRRKLCSNNNSIFDLIIYSLFGLSPKTTKFLRQTSICEGELWESAGNSVKARRWASHHLHRLMCVWALNGITLCVSRSAAHKFWACAKNQTIFVYDEATMTVPETFDSLEFMEFSPKTMFRIVTLFALLGASCLHFASSTSLH